MRVWLLGFKRLRASGRCRSECAAAAQWLGTRVVGQNLRTDCVAQPKVDQRVQLAACKTLASAKDQDQALAS